jgi:peptidoglycan LD-endopeptidase LytH
MIRTTWIFSILIFALAAAACTIETTPAPEMPTSTLPPSATITPLPTATSIPIETALPPKTPTAFTFPTVTITPTPMPMHVFPISPTRFVDYVDGHSGYFATDIFAPEGYEFLAVTDGMVSFASPEDLWDPLVDDPNTRGGIAVAIIGDDGVRYYGGHLSALAEGIEERVRVSAGQVLGWVGRTGNARDTTSHVHFAISRPTYPEDWKTRRGQVNPCPYLIAWQNGANLIPALP